MGALLFEIAEAAREKPQKGRKILRYSLFSPLYRLRNSTAGAEKLDSWLAKRLEALP